MKGRIYIINTKNLREKDFELVGSEAVDNALLAAEGILIPPSFVITSITFDDFLTAADLIGPISKSLSKVRPFIRETARDASEEITSLILNARFPSIMAEPISHAYQNLVDNNEQPLVSMLPSNIIDPKFSSNGKILTESVLIKGINDLLYNIKLAWLTLFTTDAIEARANTYYKGPLSLGLIIQKKVRPEVSGKAYSIELDENDKHTIQINALYGIEHASISLNDSDVYKVNKKEVKISERNIKPQEEMFVTKHKFEKGEDPYIQVEISPAWRNAQKIDDAKILNIAKIISRVEEKFKVPIDITWGIETGDIYVLNLKPQKKEEETRHGESQPSDVTQHKKIHTRLEPDKKASEPNIKELTEEIQAIVENEKKLPEVIEQINEEAQEQTIERPLVLPELVVEEVENVKLKSVQEFNVKTPLFLDISTMNSRVLTALNNFSGSFYDGTELVLNNNTLPEEYKGNSNKLTELIEKYALDISIAAKSTGDKPLIYQFSTITDYELKLLGIQDGKYKYNHDERFIDFPEALSVEAIAVKKALQQNNSKNLSICFPGVRNLKNLQDLTKVINTQGLKKNHNFKFYVEVSIPSFVFEFDKIGKSDINGIIVNYSKLLKLSSHRTELREADQTVGFKQLQLLKTLASEKNMEFFVKVDIYNDDLLDELIKLTPNGIIFTHVPSKGAIDNIEHMESFFYKEKPKNTQSNRGRKIKDLY